MLHQELEKHSTALAQPSLAKAAWPSQPIAWPGVNLAWHGVKNKLDGWLGQLPAQPVVLPSGSPVAPTEFTQVVFTPRMAWP